MSKKEVPAYIEVTCDVCRSVCDKSSRRESGALTIKRNGLDLQGQAVGDASIHRDLCDNCLNKIITAVNNVTIKIRKEDIDGKS